ncbi:DNA methyltransferase [Chloroflexota bacterium]
MKQHFKSIYFQDHPAKPSAQRHIRLAFGDNESSLYKNVKNLSSEELRRLLGMESFEVLVEYARNNALSLNRACISLLHRNLGSTYHLDLIDIPALESDPLIATYRNGYGEPLHYWFPLLEGYSSRFVKAVMKTYAPEAQRIFDPFSGTGSAPLAVASMGLTGYYCEINPVLQFITETKYKVMQLSGEARRELAEKVQNTAFNIGFQLGNQDPNEYIRETYSSTFNGSMFFDDNTFEDVLRLRTFCDTLLASSPLLGQVVLVAVLASLVPSSLMVRRGDLRFKRPDELSKSGILLHDEVSRRLQEMALEITELRQINGEAILLAENAQSLAKCPYLNIECVITSPPYLNGTNYFRNTKLELWFLRALRKRADLTIWRSKSLTAGINDVTQAKCNKPHPEDIDKVVKDIKASAYDSRIPLMVASYFRELDQFFNVLSGQLATESIVAIDIGDSRYGGVHVETDKLLSQLLTKRGFQALDTRTLRVRRSRDGELLKQTLLVFKYQNKQRIRTSSRSSIDHISAKKWNQFKKELPHQTAPFSKRNWGHPLHSLCSYEGKMKPAIAHLLVDAFVPEGGKILDPFAGVGTILFEACLQGKEAFGFEISPPAFAVSVAKVNEPDASNVWKLLNKLENYINSEKVTDDEMTNANQINFNRSLEEFYHEDTFKEILLARRFFLGLKPHSIETNFVLACLLHILHGNRPYALSRRSHPITPFAPQGPYEYRSLVDRLKTKVERSLAVEYPSEFQNGHIFMQDATSWWPVEVDNIDAVVTSPPFFDSTRFYLANWIRLWFSGWERDNFTTEPLRFLDMKQKQTMRIYESVFRQARERMKLGGVLVMHLGKSTKCNMAERLNEIAKPWFKTLDIFEENVSHCESHGIRDKGTVSSHQYLIMY